MAEFTPVELDTLKRIANEDKTHDLKDFNEEVVHYLAGERYVSRCAMGDGSTRLTLTRGGHLAIARNQ